MDNLDSAALAGIDIVLTRPVGGAAALLRSLRGLGARCINLPMLSIRDCAADVELIAGLADAEQADAIVFASVNAVRACWRLNPHFAPRGRVFAQGPATATALRGHGQTATVPAQGYATEDLLRDDFFKEVGGRRIVRMAGVGGRDLLVQALRNGGAQATAIALYARVPSRLDRRHLNALMQMPDPIVVVTSAESLARLPLAVSVSIAAHLLGRRLLVSSRRLHDEAAALGFTRIAQAHSAASADLRAGLGRLADASRGR